MAQLDYYRNFQVNEAAEAAAERRYHANHVCNETCPPAGKCAIHGIVGDDCDEACLEATKPQLFR